MLTNFAFLSQTDNRSIQDKAPSEYKNLIPIKKIDDILDSALIPRGGLDMKYDEFIQKRSCLLAKKAEELCNKKTY